MSTFKVDNEQVASAIETLKTLLAECEEAYNKEIPTSSVDKGKSHETMVVVCDYIKATCYNFGQLISNSIEFLGQSSEMFEQSDKQSATYIAEGSTVTEGSSGTTHGGGGQRF